MNNNLYDGTSSILSVSSNKISHCGLITKKLLELGICSKITPNQSIICNNNNCWLENGCTILLSGLNPKYIGKKVWEPLNNDFNLKCGYLKIEKQFNGCIFDYLKESNCPGPEL